MSREKQIEEMADIITDIDDSAYAYNDDGFEITAYANSTKIAEKLYNAGYRKQEWISVDERLPEEDGEYLTWDGLIYFLVWFNASLGLWNVSEGGDTSTAMSGFTHWMPLPEAPKMKGGAE